jgi:hypothetical protein
LTYEEVVLAADLPLTKKGELWQGTDTFGGIFKQEDKNGLESLQDIMERVLAKRAELQAGVECVISAVNPRFTY